MAPKREIKPNFFQTTAAANQRIQQMGEGVGTWRAVETPQGVLLHDGLRYLDHYGLLPLDFRPTIP